MHAGDPDVLKSSTMKTKSGVFSFEGRIGLEEYWGNMAVGVIIGFGISLMADTGAACFALLLLPCYLWYVLAFMSKRCHDLGNPGSYILIPFYPLVLAFGAGDLGANDYGPNPNDLAKHMFETMLTAEQGFVRAQYNLGICYHDGIGVPRDKVEAVKCYRKAAELGFAPAQFNLGICYFNGAGVAKDEIEASAYVNLAGITYEAARKHLAILEKQMTPDQIDAGKKRTKELQKEIEAKITAKKAEDANKADK